MRGRYRGGRSRSEYSGERRQEDQGRHGSQRGYAEGGWGDEREWESRSGYQRRGQGGVGGAQGYQGSRYGENEFEDRYESEYQGGYGEREYGGNPGAFEREGRWGSRAERSFPGSSAFGGRSEGYGRGYEAGEYRGTWRQQRGPMTGRGPKGYQRSDERIREDVSEALSRHGQVDASEITVEVRGGEVILTGSVDSREAKREAERAVENEPGVREVQNQLRVQERMRESQSQGSESRTSQRSGVPSADQQSESRGRSRSSSSLGANV